MRDNECPDRTGDAELGRRLASALHAEAGRLIPPPDAWSSFTTRSATIATHDATRDSATESPRRERVHPTPVGRRYRSGARRWRVPLIVAAAVATIALATAAVVTGTFGPAGHVPAAGSGASGSAGSSAGAKTECTPAGSGTTIPVANSPANSHLTVRMGFAQGSPPTAGLCGSFGNGGITADSGVIPDGTPLGYLSLSGGVPQGALYVWGAVGPKTAAVRITAVHTTTDPAPDLAVGTSWTVGPPAADTSDASVIRWTDLGDGWHGFALQLPEDTATVLEDALRASGVARQSRRIDVATGRVTDLPTNAASVAATAGPTAPPTATIILPASDDPCATVPKGRGAIRADDEGTAVLAHLDAAGTTLCFSDGSDWTGALPVNGPKDQVMRFFGVTEPEPGGDPVNPTRLVFGLIDADATKVAASAGIEQVGPLHPLPGTDLRLFVMRAGPGAGSVTVSDDAGHQVTQPVAAVADASGPATRTAHR